MAKRAFNSQFRKLRREFSDNAKRSFLRDIQGQIEEDEDIYDILKTTTGKQRYLAVTFDRRKNDDSFSYVYFDLVIVLLDRLAGGRGIYKPANQLRVLKWNAKKSDLLKVLLYFASNNTQLRFKRALILPFPTPAVGFKIDGSIHMR